MRRRARANLAPRRRRVEGRIKARAVAVEVVAVLPTAKRRRRKRLVGNAVGVRVAAVRSRKGKVMPPRKRPKSRERVIVKAGRRATARSGATAAVATVKIRRKVTGASLLGGTAAASHRRVSAQRAEGARAGRQGKTGGGGLQGVARKDGGSRDPDREHFEAKALSANACFVYLLHSGIVVRGVRQRVHRWL